MAIKQKKALQEAIQASKNKKEKSTQRTVEPTQKQEDDRSIDFETFRKRGGFYRNKEELLAAMLKSHLKGGAVHPYGEGEAGFARLIDSHKLFYKKQEIDICY